MPIYRLSSCTDADYPTIQWSRHKDMADLWLEVDERHKVGLPVSDLLERISYRLRLSKRWPEVDCVAMAPGLAASARARAALEALGTPGMQFLPFRINDRPYFRFYTERRVDCLDREKSEIEYFRSGRVMRVLRYAFREEALQPRDLFTVPELSEGMFFWVQETLLTEEARLGLEQCGLAGLQFTCVTG